MSIYRTALRTAPFVEPINLREVTAKQLILIPPDKVALVEHISPDLIPRLSSLLQEAQSLVAEVYLGQRPDLPAAVLVPSVYVIVEPTTAGGEMFDRIAATSAVPLREEEWDRELEALEPLLTEPLGF